MPFPEFDESGARDDVHPNIAFEESMVSNLGTTLRNVKCWNLRVLKPHGWGTSIPGGCYCDADDRPGS